MKLLFIEPHFGGSHRLFAQGLLSHSSHDIDLLTLPDRNWAWRMHGSALYVAHRLQSTEQYDGIILGSMLRLSDLKAALGPTLPPVLVYFHESQLTYPQPKAGGKQDTGLIMGEISTALLADRLVFNSEFHRQAFLSAIDAFMARVPDCPLTWARDDIETKSEVLYPGLDFDTNPSEPRDETSCPLIIWNHRWSYDKNAPSFFYALDAMAKRNVPFHVALLGECPGWVPQEFETARQRLGDRVIQYGFLENRSDYVRLLKQGHLVVSTARQENFGMSVVEALKYGCLPLLPDRLSYPEILPERFHHDGLYSSQRDFLGKLERLLGPDACENRRREDLSKAMDRFSWPALIHFYDTAFERLCG
jgi:glycosyltransferase involved in cell wall biosynthesis